MPVINYHSVDGLLLGETGASGRRDYLPDALGSTMGTADGTTGALKNEYRYRPYGGFLLQGSAEPDPAFLWTGETGSRSSGAPHAGQYNRARTYARETGRWTSVDPLWPDESAYGYVGGNPTTFVDPEGMRPQVKGDPHWSLKKPKRRVRPGAGLMKCRSLTKGNCFACATKWYKDNALYGPMKACDSANAWCGASNRCTPIGTGRPKKSPGCKSIDAVMDYAEYLHTISDKLAHCYAVCATTRCFGIGAFHGIRYPWEDDILDQAAEDYGLECAAKGSRDLMRPSCLDACANAVYDLPSY